MGGHREVLLPCAVEQLRFLVTPALKDPASLSRQSEEYNRQLLDQSLTRGHPY